MIVLDTSAIVAIALAEPERDAFIDRIIRATEASLSTGNYVETSMVLESRSGGDAHFATIMAFLTEIGVRVISLDPQMADLACDAFRIYGKGRHPARLNFGDCFAYALAKALDAPLLYKGVDFAKTDIVSA